MCTFEGGVFGHAVRACRGEKKIFYSTAIVNFEGQTQASLIDGEMDGSTNRGSADCDLVIFLQHVLDLLQMERGVRYQHLVHQL